MRQIALLLAFLWVMAAAWGVSAKLGLQEDEALFATGMYTPDNVRYAVADHRVALMIFPYIGALKSWLYSGWFSVVEPGLRTIRMPMAFAGAVMLVLLADVAYRLAGKRALLLVVLVGATQPVWLLATTMDWGPIALQTMLLVMGLWALQRGWALAAGLAWGIALFDKATFSWVLGGLGLAALFWWRQLLPPGNWRQWGRWPVLHWAAGLVLGSLPLWYFNWKNGFETFRSNAHLSFEDLPTKWSAFQYVLDGRAVISYFIRSEGPPKGSWLFALMLVALLAALWKRNRAALAAWVAAAAALLVMFGTVNAGGSAHHHLLAWPLLLLATALSLAALERGKWVALFFAGYVAVMQCSLWMLHKQKLEAMGGQRMWSVALVEMAKDMMARRPERLYVTDWGLGNGMLLLSKGTVRARMLSDDWGQPEQPPQGRQQIAERLREPGVVLLRFTEDAPYFPSTWVEVDKLQLNWKVTEYRDAQGRVVVAAFEKQADGPKGPAALPASPQPAPPQAIR